MASGTLKFQIQYYSKIGKNKIIPNLIQGKHSQTSLTGDMCVPGKGRVEILHSFQLLPKGNIRPQKPLVKRPNQEKY